MCPKLCMVDMFCCPGWVGAKSGVYPWGEVIAGCFQSVYCFWIWLWPSVIPSKGTRFLQQCVICHARPPTFIVFENSELDVLPR